MKGEGLVIASKIGPGVPMITPITVDERLERMAREADKMAEGMALAEAAERGSRRAEAAALMAGLYAHLAGVLRAGIEHPKALREEKIRG